jgi:tRNA(fMet)-specific endonuclease VapC
MVLSPRCEICPRAGISGIEASFTVAAWAKPIENRHEVERFAARLSSWHSMTAVLGRCGQPIGAYDLLIAGHARGRGRVVVTSDLGEFQQVAGWRCEDWLA